MRRPLQDREVWRWATQYASTSGLLYVNLHRYTVTSGLLYVDLHKAVRFGVIQHIMRRPFACLKSTSGLHVSTCTFCMSTYAWQKLFLSNFIFHAQWSTTSRSCALMSRVLFHSYHCFDLWNESICIWTCLTWLWKCFYAWPHLWLGGYRLIYSTSKDIVLTSLKIYLLIYALTHLKLF